MKNQLRLRQTYLTTTLLFIFFITSYVSAQTIPQLAEKTLAATVFLEMTDRTGKPTWGSGFFVKPDIIATNYHVIEGAYTCKVKRVGKPTIYSVEEVVATDKENDLALLKVSTWSLSTLVLIENSDTVKIGETVYVAGNPKLLEGTFSDGIISGQRSTGYNNKRFQMTAPISPGSSGGPVINRNGKVVGVSVSGFSPQHEAQNLNFAIPSNYLKKLLSQTQKPVTFVKPSPQGKRPILPSVKGKSQYKSAYTYLQQGIEKREQGEHVGAIKDFTNAIRLEPDNAKAYFQRGYAQYKLKQHFLAIADYSIAIRLKPNFAFAYESRALARYSLRQFTNVITDCNYAIRFDSNNAFAYNLRGSAKDYLGKFVEAMADYDLAISKNKDYAHAYYNRGLVKCYFKRIVEGKRDFYTALRLARKQGNKELVSDIQNTLRELK